MEQAKSRKDDLGVQFGKYRIFGRLATGGMAELFLAKLPGPGGFSKTVVLKCILPHLAKEEAFVEMFLDEARIVAPLDHPNIVQIHEIGERNSIYYIAMEFIRGQSLREFRKKLYKDRPDIASPYALAAGLVAQAAAGLHHAHTAIDDDGCPLQIIHRDVSPTNLLVSYSGILKVVDFGVAKATTQQHRTSAGTIKGKYRYMSPEQISNFHLDHRSDIFSLGIILYEMTTNVGLFGRKSELEVIKAVSEAQVVPPSRFHPSYPPELEAILLKALSLDRDQRHQTADELRQDLERFMQTSAAYYGPAQITDVMTALFSEEAKGEKTGLASPLTPPDFVRFAGQISSADNYPSYPPMPHPSASGGFYYPTPDASSPQLMPGSSPQLMPGSNPYLMPGSNPYLMPYGQGGYAPPPQGYTGPHPAMGYGPPQVQGQPQGYHPGMPPHHAPQDPAYQGQRHQTPPHLQRIDDRVRDDLLQPYGSAYRTGSGLPPATEDQTPISELSSFPKKPPSSAPHDEDIRPRRSPVLLLALVLFLLLSGVGAFVFWPRTTLSPLAEEQKAIARLIASGELQAASDRLQSVQKRPDAGDARTWLDKTEQMILQIHLIRDFLKKNQIDTASQILQNLLAAWPAHPVLLALQAQVKAKTPPSIAFTEPRDRPSETRPDPPEDRPDVRVEPRTRTKGRGRRPRGGRTVAVVERTTLPRDIPVAPLQGKLYVNSKPSSARVEINGSLVGYTPLNDHRHPVGSYRLTIQAKGFRLHSRIVTLRADRPVDVNVELTSDAPTVRIEPPTRGSEPPPESSTPTPRMPFSAVRLERQTRLRLFISDPRGIAGRHATSEHRELCKKIEAELLRVMGGAFPIKGITSAWLRHVHDAARSENIDFYTFHPRGVAFAIYDNLSQGRPKARVSQLLVAYEIRKRFQSLAP